MGNAHGTPKATQGKPGASASNANAPKCYYELLGVAMTANSDDLKKAYRQRALQLHPDKNPHRLEEAHHEFAAIQAAYEVLNDPQERAWYDRNRASILAGRRRTDDEDDGPSIDDLLKYFDTSVYRGFGDDPKGFFTVYRELFEYLEEFEVEEEEAQYRQQNYLRQKSPSSFTSFGSKNSPYEPMVRQFYDKWLHFSSNRSFDEADRYQATFGDNRRMRRAMGKENNKERERLRREFGDRVRELAMFVRKRDPRWIEWQRARSEERAREEEERKTRERARREAERVAFVEADWAKVEYDQLARAYSAEHEMSGTDGEGGSEEEEVFEEQEYYCAPCRKLFKNPAQWKNHEKSKKHRSTLLSMGIDPDAVEDYQLDASSDNDDDQDATLTEEGGGVGAEGEQEEKEHGKPEDGKLEYMDRKGAPLTDATKLESSLSRVTLDEAVQPLPVMGKEEIGNSSKGKEKKSRRAKKDNPEESEYCCNVCLTVFTTRNKLFQHVRDEDHMQAIPSSASLRKANARKR